MTQEEIQKKYDRLFNKIRQVRGVQKEYFRFRAGSDLQKAKVLEREIDQMIIEEVKVQKSKQQEIFS